MRILFHKISNDRHILEIVRPNGDREQVECETRSYLQHDLLHYATEREAKLTGGFWGHLARGKTLADMNDRTGVGIIDGQAEMAMIERVVGALSAAVKGHAAHDIIASLQQVAVATESALPEWLTVDFITAIQERMRQLQGHWNGTPYGGVMELVWDE
ncbi:MAG: hypothetical protein RL141_96 [Candidatus Parcubacteria bacterium]|jgi:hypothetical protein